MSSNSEKPSFQEIIYEKSGQVATIYLNRPEKRNAVTFRMVRELREAFKLVEEDKGIRVVILAAKGKAFCAGGDVNEFLTNTLEQTERFQRENIELWRQMEKLRKPIIAAVNGYANIEMIQAVDIVIASSEARFGLPETGIGVCPGAGITIRLPRVVGKYVAKELLFTGEWISADEAKAIGLVNKVVPPERLIEEANSLALKIAKRAPLAIGAAKACVNFGSEMPIDDAMEYQLRESLAMFHTKDLQEGITAFFKEKREPRFMGE